MYKYLFVLIAICLLFLANAFSKNLSIETGKELVGLIKSETGGSNLLFRKQNKIEKGNIELNKLNVGYYVMFEKTEGEKSLSLLADNTVEFTYPLNEKAKVLERGFWKTNDDEKIEVVITGNQFSTYDESRVFVFMFNSDEKKLISVSYEKLIYGDGGLVFYRK